MTTFLPIRGLVSVLLLAAVAITPAQAIDTSIALRVPAGAVNGEVIKIKVEVVGGSEGISFETEGLQYVRGYFDHCGFCGKPCLVNDQIQACPSPPDGCCFSYYCLSCTYDSGHEFSDRWFGGPTVEYRVNACTGPNPTKARIRGRWYGGSHEGPFYTPWYEIAVGNPIVADFTYRPTDPLCAGDPIMFINTSCGGTDFHWDFGDGETADGGVVYHTFTDPGSYAVTLTATSPSGTNTKTKTLLLRGDCATVQGTVSDAVDGRGLGGATVEITRAGWGKTAPTTPSGLYIARVAPDYTYTLVGKYPGYNDSPPGSASPGANETVTVDLQLAPEGDDWTDPRFVELYNLGKRYDAIADPVNPFTGSFFFNRTLFAFPGRGDMDLAFAVSYNSALADTDSSLGFGWTHSFDIRIAEDSGLYTIFMPDGSQRFFHKSGTTYTPYNCYSPGVLADRSPSGWTYTFPEQTQWLFDAQGRLEKITNPRNHSITLTHSTQLDRITDSGGRQIDLTWAGGRIASIATPLGNPTVQFAYDGAGNLTGITDARGNAWAFTYDGQHRLLTERDRRGTVVLTTTYDAQGRVATQTDAAGQVTTFTYTALTGGRRQVVVTPPSGNAITQVYGANGQLLRVRDGEGHTASFSWDANGNLAAATDKLGKTVLFSNDAQGRLTAVIDRLGASTTLTYTAGLPATMTTVNGTTSLTYFANGNLREAWLPDKHLAAFGYDAQNQLSSISHNGRYWRYQYNAQGMPTRFEDPAGKAHTMAYDAAGRITQLTLPDGLGSYQYTWDAGGNLTTLTNPAGQQVTFAYDAENNVTSRTFVPMNATESLTYDALGRVRTHTDAMGGVTTFAYDVDSNLVAVTDPDGITTQFAYDRRNLLTKVTSPSGSEETFAYDANGRQSARTNALGHTWQAAFDAEGRTTEVRDPLGAATTLLREPGSRNVSVVNPLGEKDRLSLSALGDPLAVTAANGDSITTEYDVYGSMSRLVDGRGNAWRFAYNPVGRLAKVTGPDNRSEQYAYDALGRVTTITRPSGDQVGYEYNAEGRPSRITLPGGGQVTFAYAYSAAGLVVTVTEALGVSTFVYDKLYRLVERTDAQGNTVKYAYTSAGRLASVTYPGNRVLAYTYDAAGRLQQLTDWTGKVTTFQYDAADRLARIDLPNGTATTYTYDAADRPASEVHLGPGGTTLLSFAMTRDAAGRITAMTTSGTLAPDLADGTRERSVDPSNRLVYERAGTEAATFTFDADGRQVERRRGAQVTSYNYDARGDLSGVADGIHATTYVRDFAGSCLRMVMDGVETRFLRDGNELRATLDAANAPTRFFVGAGAILYTLDPSGAIRVLHADPQGSVVAVTDGSGALVARFAYDPYGRTVAAQGQSELGYLGSFGVVTDANGLLHTGVRMYDPDSRRFLTEDPLGVLVAPNLYSYVDGDPLNVVDPSGAEGESIIWQLSGGWDRMTYLQPGEGNPMRVLARPRNIPTSASLEMFASGTPSYPSHQYPGSVRRWFKPRVPDPQGFPSSHYNVRESVFRPKRSATWAQSLESGSFRGGAPRGFFAGRQQGFLPRNVPATEIQFRPSGGWNSQLVKGIEGGAERTLTGKAVGSSAGRLLGRFLTLDLLPVVGYYTARFSSSSLVFIYNENTGGYESGDQVVTNYLIPGQIAAWAPPEDQQFEFKKRLHKIKRDFFAGLKRNALPK